VPVTSVACRLPSSQVDGLLSAALLAWLVIVIHQIVRPSWLRPISLSAASCGCSAANSRSAAVSSS